MNGWLLLTLVASAVSSLSGFSQAEDFAQGRHASAKSRLIPVFCVMQVWNLNGQLIESRPLKPTVPVKWTVEDLFQGRDPDLEAALLHLERQKD